MAQTMRQRTVINAGRKRKKNRPRHLSAKQIKYFGSPRQKAALRGRKSATKGRRHSPAARRRTAPKRSNPGGEIIGYTLANSATKRNKGTMAKSRKTRKASAGSRHHTKHRKNTGRRHHRPARRRNAGSTFGGIGPLVTNAVFVIAGALGSKLLTQMVLGTNNTGFIGYGGNAAAGAILYFVTDKVMKNRNAANGILAGTAVQIVLRLINDYTPFGQYVANLGMGDYQAQAFVTPQVLVDPFNRAEIKIPAAWRPAPMIAAPAAAAGMGAASAEGGNLYGGRNGLY